MGPELLCQDCLKPLAESPAWGEKRLACPECGALFVGGATLDRVVRKPVTHALWRAVALRRGRPGARCPACRKTMLEVDLVVDELVIPLDVCEECRRVRFDPGELEQLPLKERYERGHVESADRIARAAREAFERARPKRLAPDPDSAAGARARSRKRKGRSESA